MKYLMLFFDSLDMAPLFFALSRTFKIRNSMYLPGHSYFLRGIFPIKGFGIKNCGVLVTSLENQRGKKKTFGFLWPRFKCVILQLDVVFAWSNEINGKQPLEIKTKGEINILIFFLSQEFSKLLLF